MSLSVMVRLVARADGWGALLRGGIFGVVAVVAFFIQPYRMAYNHSVSEPLGWYLTRRLSPSAELHRGELVVMRYEGPSVARYQRVAPYASGTLFIKRIQGVAGDRVREVADHIERTTAQGRMANLGPVLRISPSGKLVPKAYPWTGQRLGAHDYYLSANRVPYAFDSRYFGPVSRDRILARAWPVWVSGTSATIK